MDDDNDDKDDSKRRTRNLSEKKRRDQFNMLVSELGSMVSTNNRKMDKSTVLKSTISFLKNHNEITVRSRAHDVQEDWKPAFLSNEEFTYLVLEALEGFVMVFSVNGCIYYVSESIMSLLGHKPTDMVNKSIFDLAFDDDRSNLYALLQNPSIVLQPNQTISSENEIRFQCHLQRGALDFRDDITYELVQFKGHFRTYMEQNDSSDILYQQDQESRLLFVCTGKLCTPQLIRDVSLVDTSRSEFTSRHSLEWKFLFLDHRAPPIIGYLPFEVLGTSGYDYYHFDDLEKVVTCHEALMQKGELTSCYYRFLTKGQQWIWLQTRFYITYHQWNSKPEFVVCTHRVVSYEDMYKGAKHENVDTETASEAEPKISDMKETSSEDAVLVMSPSYMSDPSEAFGSSYQSLSQPPSVKSTAASTGDTVPTMATTATSSWPTCASQMMFSAGSDTASVSGDSRSPRLVAQDLPRLPQPAIVPQHVMGAQYLEPGPYIGSVGVSGVLTLPMHSVPLIVTPDQAQLQLQRTHRELQQMIVRQQEELRQVKEQLLLARLGILQPLINVQDTFPHTEQVQQDEMIPAQMLYDGPAARPIPSFPQQPPPPPPGGHHVNTHQNQNQNHHNHMPPQL